MPKKIHFPIRLEVVVNQTSGALEIVKAKLRFNQTLEEYPELKPIPLVSRLALDPLEQVALLSTVRALLKKHLKIDSKEV